VVVICFALVAQPEIPILDRALYGFGAIFIGIIIRRVVKSLMPLAEDNVAEK
jgi:ABC-type molybdenum transport system ATPase subunit/photorepair protein PhrA